MTSHPRAPSVAGRGRCAGRPGQRAGASDLERPDGRATMKASFAIAAAAAAGFVLAQPALGQGDDKKLGQVHFEPSCTPEAQKHFDRAMLYQHSFWYRASQMAFEDTLKADPECAIPYWGFGLSLLLNS